MPGKNAAIFEWDDANRAHIARHKITSGEVEEILRTACIPIDTEERGGEERNTELGQTLAGRLLIVVWTWRRGRIRVVTAFPANKRWRGLWRRLTGENHAEEETSQDPERG